MDQSHRQPVEVGSAWSTGLHVDDPKDGWDLEDCHTWRSQASVVHVTHQQGEETVPPLEEKQVEIDDSRTVPTQTG